MDTPQTGVIKTVVKNGNGDKIEFYTASAKRLQVWVALLLGICTLAAVVFGAARFGMQHEIHETIDAEITPPDGVIYRMGEDCAEKHIGKVAEEIDELENNVIRLETKQETIIERQQQQHAEQMRLLREIRGSG
jgi:hypothetical protein